MKRSLHMPLAQAHKRQNAPTRQEVCIVQDNVLHATTAMVLRKSNNQSTTLTYTSNHLPTTRTVGARAAAAANRLDEAPPFHMLLMYTAVIKTAKTYN